MHRSFITSLTLAFGLVMVSLPLARASDEHDHDRARRAVEAGEVLPLKSILERVERDYPGQVMEVELEREHGRWLYEIKVLRSGGALLKLKLDARDGTPVGKKERPHTREKP